MLKMLSFKLLLLAMALGFFEGDAKFGERSEGSGARRRRCLNGNPPKRLKRRDRRMMSQLELLSGEEMLCGGFYPRLSCCLRSDSPGLGRLDSKEVVSGLRQPVSALHSGDGSHRLFILEKEGYVKILTPEGEIFKEPYLDIHKRVQSGIKHDFVTPSDNAYGHGGSQKLPPKGRKNPHQVDLRTARVFLEVAELHRKHLGGQLLFGPDGFLYIILGDGMITLDDMEEMDGLSDFTGSVLRLDVDTDMCNVPYSIPRSNPHFNSTNQPPEVFAHGLHDPGRCAVDRHPTDININLTILCSDSNGKNRSSARILQIIKGKDYESEPSLLEFKPFSNGPVVGGFVYRGCQSERLYGSYVFGDRNGNFLTLQQSPVTKQWQEKPLCLASSGSCRGYFSGHILGFGEDELGEVYILSSSKSMTQTHNGKLYKIVDPKRNAERLSSLPRHWLRSAPGSVGMATVLPRERAAAAQDGKETSAESQNVSQHVVMEASVLDRTNASAKKAILVLSVNKWTETSAE
ncbi:Hedgehog-interacting protein [Pteropus alecto]|uniref:Hedgehog-interacting protein n=1 Tax=Pteropus alecto TaxID=9402 RepID=L5L281_PTEAL|nr:Hedgehog-interacting protein [Pteropus alecto]